jgi:OOP family OmpA-OmpF porin
MKPIRMLVLLVTVVIAMSSCTAGATTQRYDLGSLPGTNQELGWWAAVSTTPASDTPVVGQTTTVELTVPSDVLFAEGDATLVPDARDSLGQVAQEIIDRNGHDIVIVGYTDRLGDDESNRQLGQQRAGAVANALITDGLAGALPGQLLSGGETSPLCQEVRTDGSDDIDCRARNRRVTVTYTYTAQQRPEGQ